MANSPLTDDKNEFLNYIIDKGAQLAILLTQKKTFLRDTNFKESDIPGLKNKVIHPLKVVQKQNQERLEKAPKFDQNVEIQQALLYDNFSSIIERVRLEILAFEVDISPTVSIAIKLVENLLTTDNLTNRKVAISYLLAKQIDIKDQESLSDLISATFISHIGLTQIDRYFSHAPIFELAETKRSKYEKHAGLSLHLMRKSHLELSHRCQNIFLDHHERWDGRGYPMLKRGEYIDPLALVLGIVSHLFEYSSGRIVKNKKEILSVIGLFQNKIFTPGLEFEFGATIYDNLINLINKSMQENLAA